MPSLLIQNGTIINPLDRKNPEQVADVLVENGVIQKIGKGIKAKADEAIDASGKIVTAGLVDMHVHLREPGREDKETIRTATLAAAKGGVTSVLAMPNTNPPIDDQSMVKFVLEKAKAEGVARVFTTGNMTKEARGKEMAELWEMKNNGVKVINDDAARRCSMELHFKLLEYCRTHDLVVMSHTEYDDADSGPQMNEGRVSAQLGLAGSPAAMEDASTAFILEYLRAKPLPFHFTQVSTAGAVRLIRQAKKDGLPVTADTAPHYAALTDEACLGYNTQAKVWPPIRAATDREAIQKAIADGTIDCLVSDHAPHTLVEKYVEFQNAAFGIVGLETLFPVLYTELVATKIIPLARLIEMLTVNPARVIREDVGQLTVGKPADISIFDITTEYTIDKNQFVSKARNTVWDGKKVKGRATDVFVGGKAVVREGALTVMP